MVCVLMVKSDSILGQIRKTVQGYYKELQRITVGFKGYKGLQEVTRSYRGLQEVTRK